MKFLALSVDMRRASTRPCRSPRRLAASISTMAVQRPETLQRCAFLLKPIIDLLATPEHSASAKSWSC